MYTLNKLKKLNEFISTSHILLFIDEWVWMLEIIWKDKKISRGLRPEMLTEFFKSLPDWDIQSYTVPIQIQKNYTKKTFSLFAEMLNTATPPKIILENWVFYVTFSIPRNRWWDYEIKRQIDYQIMMLFLNDIVNENEENKKELEI